MKSKTIYKNKSKDTKKLTKKQKQKQNKQIQITKTQSGGLKLGQGSYGCAIKPHIECDKPIPPRFQNKSLVSKIIPVYNESIESDIINELKINIAIKKLDPKHKFFAYAVDQCYANLTNKVGKRSNITSNIMTREEFKEDKNKKACNIDPSINTINIISIDAGLPFKEVLVLKKYEKERKILRNRFPIIIKNLLQGLSLLHQNGIAHLDIKYDNMGIEFNGKSAYVRYLDFGFSEINKNIDITKKTINDINIIKGTPSFMSPDMYLINELTNRIKHLKDSRYLFEPKIRNIIIKNTYNSIKDDTETAYKESYQMNRDVLEYPSVKEKGFFDRLVGNVDIIQMEDITKLYNQIITLHHNDELITEFYKLETGIIYKYDIFALGVSFFLIGKYLEITISKLNKLIRHMIDTNPIKRFSAKECLEFLQN